VDFLSSVSKQGPSPGKPSMPLLKRKPFTPEKPPENLDPDEEVFVCIHTNEVFTDYE